MHERPLGKVGALPVRIAAAISYFTFIPATLFLVLDPYKKNRELRVHSFQSILFCVACLLIALLLRIAGMVLLLIPIVGPLLYVILAVVAVIAAFLLWVVIVLKALTGEGFKVPILWDLANRLAGSLDGAPMT